MPGEQQILRAGSKDTKLQTHELLSVEQRLSDDKFDSYVESVKKYKEYPIYFCSIPQDMEEIKKINESVFTKYPSHTVINLIDWFLGELIQSYKGSMYYLNLVCGCKHVCRALLYSYLSLIEILSKNTELNSSINRY